MAGSFTLGIDVELVRNDAVDLLIRFIWTLATPVASAAIAHPRDFVVLLVRVVHSLFGGRTPQSRRTRRSQTEGNEGNEVSLCVVSVSVLILSFFYSSGLFYF
jgi:hypothetical protein